MLIPANCGFHLPGVRVPTLASYSGQVSLFGRSADGMSPVWVYEGADGVLVVYNGVTRATRIAQLSPGTMIRVEVIGRLPRECASLPKIGDSLA
jgi:hypothetical protein